MLWIFVILTLLALTTYTALEETFQLMYTKPFCLNTNACKGVPFQLSGSCNPICGPTGGCDKELICQEGTCQKKPVCPTTLAGARQPCVPECLNNGGCDQETRCNPSTKTCVLRTPPGVRGSSSSKRVIVGVGVGVTSQGSNLYQVCKDQISRPEPTHSSCADAKRQNPQTMTYRLGQSYASDVGKYGVPMYISRVRSPGDDEWFWGVNSQGIVEFSSNKTSFIFEPIDASKNGKYFRFQEEYFIKVDSGPFKGRYLGDTFAKYGTGCGRVVAVKNTKDTASLFCIKTYYNTCQKNCPMKEDRQCFPVILFEHCRPSIYMLSVGEDGKSCPRIVGYGKNPATNFRTWDNYKYVAAINNNYPKPSVYENPSSVTFISVDGDKKEWTEYDLFKYRGYYDNNSEMYKQGICYKCPVFLDRNGREV